MFLIAFFVFFFYSGARAQCLWLNKRSGYRESKKNFGLLISTSDISPVVIQFSEVGPFGTNVRELS